MKDNKLVRVAFGSDGTHVDVPSGTFISKAAAAAGMPVEMPCGGLGTCGKCRVVVRGGVEEPDETERRLLTEDEIRSGTRLACRARLIGDAHVDVPDSSRSMVQKILSRSVLRECEIASGIRKFHCKLPAPSLADERAEFERLAGALASEDIHVRPSLGVVREISAVMKGAGYDVTAVLYHDNLIAVEPGDTTGHCCGIAYDVGSTTVVGYLMDIETGEELAVSAVMNPQMAYGDDIMSRISFAASSEDGSRVLQQSIVGALNRVAREAAAAAGVPLSRIYKATIVGNTCMTHLLLGIDVAGLGQSPYVPSISSDLCVPAHELGLKICPQAPIEVLPNVAGFVGSDLVGVLLSVAWEDDGATRLAVDIGTNGEMALSHRGRTYACSAAAGPAFEGAGISCGMRGAPGAIDSVVIRDSVQISTIDHRPPIGICGSGLVDAVAQMLDAGVIDETGRLVRPSEAAELPREVASRLVETDRGVEFILAGRDESGSGRAITLTESDIRNLQLAKGSIHAAIQTLIRTAGTSDKELSEILLAGAFGSYIRVESAIRIGLIPDIDEGRVRSIGNAAGAGARLALLCEKEMEAARMLAGSAQHLELALSPDYQMELMERMMFPSRPPAG